MNYGEIYRLGQHRLMCGDATSRADVFKLVNIGDEKIKLVLTDPPYGGQIQNKDGQIGRKGREYPVCIGDNSTTFARENYLITRIICDSQIIFGGQNFTDFLPPSLGWIFWDKDRPEGLSFSDGELAWCSCLNKVKKYSFTWNGFTREGNKALNQRIHIMQKPVELFMKIIEDYTKPGDIILDCFGGSGTTLIACEQTGRKCFMMEISTEYCEKICERFENLTGIQRGKINGE